MQQTHAMPEPKTTPSARDCVGNVLQRKVPPRVVYAPNYWQWFTHFRNHGLLPAEIAGCSSQLELFRHLGLDVYSRNIYCDPTRCWFGGLAEEHWDGSVEVEVRRTQEGRDTITEKRFHTKAGVLSERLRYVFSESTLVQEKFLIDDFDSQREAFDALVRARRWKFNRALFEQWRDAVGEAGVVNAGELFSPLKAMHLAVGASDAVFVLEDHPELCREWRDIHEAAQLDLVRQMLAAGVESMISMDNLDTVLHPPHYVERWSAGFYEKAAQLCRSAGAVFLIHACGQQRANLKLISSLGVDGLEGVAYPTLGDVQLDEAMRLSGDRMIITGGISAIETEKFKTRDEVRRHVSELFGRMAPYRNRFMLSSSCNTSIRTPWETLVWFRDAWREFGC